ncbi:mechanosensitive ion channel [Synechocystis sp. CS-94]|nr:mechanosensitive ion channel [Synechocystis sp. CS-94]
MDAQLNPQQHQGNFSQAIANLPEQWHFVQIWFIESLTTPIFKLGAQNITLWWIVQSFFLLILVGICAKGTKQFLKKFLLLKLGFSEGNREVLGTLTSLGVAVLGFIIVLQAMGLELASFAVIMGGLGIGIGFGLQELTRNLVSGLTIFGENKLKVGDLIEFNNHIGYIKEISIRSTIIRTFKGSDLVVPNTDLTSNLVVNWNYENCSGRLEIPVSVEYGSDLVLVTEMLLESASMEKNIVSNPPPKVVFLGFGENALNFELWVWTERIDQRFIIFSSLNHIIQYNCSRRGINMPFPQRDLWLRNPESISSTIGEQSIDIVKDRKNLDKSPTLTQLLKKNFCFENLNDLDLRNVIESGERIYLQPGEILVRQNQYHSYFCVVLIGAINAIYENEKISNRMFTFTQGEFFGELPLMLEVPYPTTMIAAEETALFLIGKDCFHQLLSAHPQLSDRVAEELAKRQDALQQYQQKLKEMGLLVEADLKNPVEWIRQRINKIFDISQKSLSL